MEGARTWPFPGTQQGKMLNKLKINTSSEIHQRPEVTGHRVVPQIGERQAHTENQRSRNIHGNPRPARRLLEAQCRQVRELKLQGDRVRWGPRTLISFTSRNPTRFSQWRLEKNPFVLLAGAGARGHSETRRAFLTRPALFRCWVTALSVNATLHLKICGLVLKIFWYWPLI